MMELWRLFLAFLQIGLFSIGGGYAVIPAIQQQVVETYEWSASGCSPTFLPSPR